MKSIDALNYLNDIAHGRKMIYDPQDLKNIVEKELKALEIIRNNLCKVVIDIWLATQLISQKEYDLLKQVLKGE